MYDLDVPDPHSVDEAEEPIGDRCTVTAWRPPVAGIEEVFHAHIVDWGYPRHSHDTWTVLIVDHGAIDYSLDRKQCAAVASSVAILPPGVIHDGRPAKRAYRGFWKRCLYLDADALPSELIGPAVDETVLHDPALRASLSALHDSLFAEEDALDVESRLAVICERLASRLGPAGRPDPIEPRGAEELRSLLDEAGAEPLALADAASVLDRSVPHLVRSFTASFGVSPHAYLIGRRIESARSMLLAGMAPADVATSAGFYDQAHLTRHFKRHTSTTPARYARSSPTR